MRIGATTNLSAATFALLLGMPVTGEASAAPPSPQGSYVITSFAADNIAGCGSILAASPTCYFNVDSLTNDQTYVYAGYQNTGAANGSSGSSIVAKYAKSGGAPLQFSPAFAGKTDGLRVNPFTHQLWTLNNEDGNPVLRIIDPQTMSVVLETPLPTDTPFSGGYDDLVFTPDGTFMSASNPGLTRKGMGNYRTVVRVDFAGNGNIVLTPVLPGHIVATDRVTGAQVNLTLTDPDSLVPVPGTSNFVLNDQGDSTLVFMDKPGSGAPNVSVIFLGPAPTTACGNPATLPAVACPPIVDETAWVPSAGGHFLLADHAKPGAIYSVSKVGGFAVGSVYASVSSDNPTLAKTLGVLDLNTGNITPAVTGLSGPKALIYLSD